MTYSIVAIDPTNGTLGVGVQTHRPAVGSIVPWAETGVGAVATQAHANTGFGPQALALLSGGLSADQALRAILAGDERPEIRQVAIVDARGTSAAHTGGECIPEYGSHQGQSYSAQANMMLNLGVPEAMGAAFEEAAGSLEERIMAALEAGQGAGGDIRGMQSCAILVRAPEAPATDRTPSSLDSADVDLRVDDGPDPLAKLRGLLNIRHAEALMRSAAAEKSVDGARDAFERASRLSPSDEITFWYGVRSLSLNLGAHEEAAGVLTSLFERKPNWRELLHRLPELPAESPLRMAFPRE